MLHGEDIRAARRARGWSIPILAAALTEAAQRQGVHLMSPASLKTSISRWENGHVSPDDLYSRLLAAVLYLPYAGDPLARGVEYPRDIVDTITVLDALADADHGGDAALATAGAITSMGASQVVTGYLFAGSPALALGPAGPVRGVEVADRIRTTVAAMMSMDFARGGGHVRRQLLEFFRTQVVPQLHAVHPEAVRREIFSAAAEVAQLLGWSAYDAGRHPAAIRYFVQGLRLAEEGSDQLMGGRLLANLSHQANFMGRFDDAVMYARAAQQALQGRHSPAVETMCVMMEARGLASLSDQHATALVIHRAEQIFERRHDDEPGWIGYYDPAELAGDASHCWRDLQLAPETKTFVGEALTEDTPPRTRAFIQMVAADGALVAGDLDEAGALAAAAVVNGGDLRSARYLQYLKDFHDRLPPGAARHRALAEFVDLLHTHHPAIVAAR
ncbi:helix-turn-helix domain-containing protein [Nocardia sp. NPDC059240]|uniref:helix-turn-helix domain-containing protein n=1 Tax=Nocardia sp. NPDC059240 TaxID=3346786 RepID=UPI0036BD88BA